MDKVNIDALLESIEAYEIEIITAAEDSIKLSSVQTLMKLYQQAVEYFSVSESGLVMSKQIMDRMQGIMSREHVQNLLAPSIEESKEYD